MFSGRNLLDSQLITFTEQLHSLHCSGAPRLNALIPLGLALARSVNTKTHLLICVVIKNGLLGVCENCAAETHILQLLHRILCLDSCLTRAELLVKCLLENGAEEWVAVNIEQEWVSWTRELEEEGERGDEKPWSR